MKNEKAFENALAAELASHKAYAQHMDVIGSDGFPDLLVLKDNAVMLIECKYNTVALRKEQTAFHAELSLKYNFTNIVVAAYLKGGYYLNVMEPDGTWSDFMFPNIKALARQILHYMG